MNDPVTKTIPLPKEEQTLFARNKKLFLSKSKKALKIHQDKEDSYATTLQLANIYRYMGVNYYRSSEMVALVYTGRPYCAGVTMGHKLTAEGDFPESVICSKKHVAEKALVEATFYTMHYNEKWLQDHPQYTKCYQQLHQDIEKIENAFVTNYGLAAAVDLKEWTQQQLSKSMKQNFKPKAPVIEKSMLPEDNNFTTQHLQPGIAG